MQANHGAVQAPEREQRLVRQKVVALCALTVLLEQLGHSERPVCVRVQQRLLLKVQVLEHDVKQATALGHHGHRRAALQLDARRH